MSEPTCQALCYSCESCFSNVGTYLPGTVLQWCRLFKHCRNLPARHCVTGVQAVIALSEPTFHALCCRGAGCLAMAEPTCRALCYSGADCLSGVGTYLPGTVLQWGRLFKDKDYCPIEIIKGLTDKGQFQYLTKLMGPQEGTYLYATQFHWLR